MNMIKDLFGITQGQGIVARLQRHESIVMFILVGLLIMAVSCGLYGYAMGIGTSPTTAWKDSLKLMLIFILSFLISLTPCLFIFKLAYSQLRARVVTVGLFSGLFLSALVLGMCAPFSFLYGLIWSVGGKLVHVILIDLAIIAGLYVSGTIFYYAVAKDKQKLVLPLILTFLFMLLAVYLLIQFFGPYFADSDYFCYGSKRLQEIFQGSYLAV